MRQLRTIAFVVTMSVVATCGGQEGSHHSAAAEDRYERLATQHVKVDDFAADGWVLAIGGGGEGVIGQLKGSQVVAVDISRRELEEAAPGPLKVVMDARDLAFVDNSFAAAASFFTLCYIAGDDHPKVLAEVWRVLEPGGSFHIWDVSLGPRPASGRDRALVPLEAVLPDRRISTGYGVRWPEIPHDLPYYVARAEAAGFVVAARHSDEAWFHLELVKR